LIKKFPKVLTKLGRLAPITGFSCRTPSDGSGTDPDNDGHQWGPDLRV